MHLLGSLARLLCGCGKFDSCRSAVEVGDVEVQKIKADENPAVVFAKLVSAREMWEEAEL